MDTCIRQVNNGALIMGMGAGAYAWSFVSSPMEMFEISMAANLISGSVMQPK